MKLIATDLDGTLLNNNHEISPENAKAIANAQQHGIKIVVATGRSYEAARKPLASIGLTCPIISLNGAKVHSVDGKIVRSIPLDKKTVASIKAACKKEEIYFELFTNKGVYSDNRENFVQVMVDIMTSANPQLTKKDVRTKAEQRFQEEEITIIADYDDVITKEDIEVYKVLAFSIDKERLQGVRNQLADKNQLAVTSSGDDNLEFNHPDAQKGIALKLFADHLDIDMRDVMAIGDNYNDLSMLQVAGRGVAMGNADNTIKKSCNYTTLTNTENGVAHAIEEMINEVINSY